ncbi:hypothetical protein MKZ38_000521 [Zalerion maritima]|uniref:NTF2-like domain-containing protein n=1 Tax=Zalerion maritima TaxID=339359 RepID=A0AAD5RF30_9PEZI|nr:hypothetical protein MKZ38_000521 [Zalerion maritima]
MHLALFLSTLLAGSVAALAVPSKESSKARRGLDIEVALDVDLSTCMTSEDTEDLVNAYIRLVSDFDEDDADRYLVDSFTDTSDSINTLVGNPLGTVTFPSKDAFVAAQLALAGSTPPVEVEDVPAVGCQSIAVIWTATFGDPAQPVRGESTLKTVEVDGDWMFESWDVEFNSIVWQENLS